MWNSVVAMVILPISFYIGSRWGTTGIAAAWILVYPAVEFPLFLRTFRRIRLPYAEYLRALWPAASGCAVMALSIEVAKSVLSGALPSYLNLGCEIAIGIIGYGTVLFLVHHKYLLRIAQFVRTLRQH